MSDPEATDTNWRTKWADGRAWALANPKAARALLLLALLALAFIAGAVLL